MKYRNLLIGIGSFVLLTCLPTSALAADNAAENPVFDEGVAPHKDLDDIYRRFSEGYKKLDPTSVANLYSETAAYLAPGENLEIGREKVYKLSPDFLIQFGDETDGWKFRSASCNGRLTGASATTLGFTR